MQVAGDTNHAIILRFDTALTVSIRRMHLSGTGEEVGGAVSVPVSATSGVFEPLLPR